MQIIREDPSSPVEMVTRQDAGRRQLSTAITLVLANGDAISANVLTWAATEMLRGVAKARGIVTFGGTLEDRIKPEYLTAWRNILKEHYNYFKHADRDPDGCIKDFSPEAATWALFGACSDYVSIFGSRTWAILVYQIWFFCRHPEIAMDEGKDLAAKMSPGLGHPAEQPLDQSVRLAYTMLEQGRKHPSILESLGPRWVSNLEPE